MQIRLDKDTLRKLPNLLTGARLAVIPLIIPLYLLDFAWLKVFVAIIFAIASATDYLDGYLARRFKIVTKMGAALDHIADKLLVTTALILLVRMGVVPSPIAIAVILREIAVLGLRLLAAERRLTVTVSTYGKVKTFAQGLALTCLLINDTLFPPTVTHIGMISLWISLILSYYSAYLYFETVWPVLKDEV